MGSDVFDVDAMSDDEISEWYDTLSADEVAVLFSSAELSDFSSALTDDERQQIVRAYAVFGVDPRRAVIASGADEFAFRFPKLSASFLREKAERQLRDDAGRWRRMLAKIAGRVARGRTDNRPLERSNLTRDQRPDIPEAPDMPEVPETTRREPRALAADGLPIPEHMVKAYGKDWERDVNGSVIIPERILSDLRNRKTGELNLEANSLVKYLHDSFDKNGNAVKVLDPKREALHDLLVSRVFDGIEPAPAWRRAIAIFMGGGSGAGKSTATKTMDGYPTTRELKKYGKGGIEHPEAALIDADGFKIALPDYHSKNAEGKNGAAYTHEESSLLTKAAQDHAIENRVDYVLDGTGDGGIGSMRGKINKAKNAGYETKGIYVNLPTDEAMIRSAARGVKSGRQVPTRMVFDIHSKVSRVAPEVMGEFDRFDLFDTDVPMGEPAVPVIVDGKVVDPEKYQSFLAKAPRDSIDDYIREMESALSGMHDPSWVPDHNPKTTPEQNQRIREKSITFMEGEIQKALAKRTAMEAAGLL